MNGQFIRLFSLPENLYQDGSPVLISAGALLKDSNTGRALVQLKFRNISQKAICLVKIKVNAYDTAGAALDGVESFSYVGLRVAPDGEFGSQTPVVLPDDNTSSFKIEILSVFFEDGDQYEPPIGASVSVAPEEMLKSVEIQRKQTYYENRLAQLSWIPLIIGIIAIVYNFLLNGDFFYNIGRRSLPEALDRSFQWFIVYYSFGGDWIRGLFVLLIIPCLFIPCVTIVCNLLSKKNSKIRYIGFLIALCYSIFYIYQTIYCISEGHEYTFYEFLATILPIIVNIASTLILFLQTRIKQAHDEKRITQLDWTPLIIGIITIVCKFLLDGRFYSCILFKSFPDALIRSFQWFIRCYDFGGDWIREVFVLLIIPCLFIPCVAIVCKLLSKKNSKIRYIGILIALCYSIFYIYLIYYKHGIIYFKYRSYFKYRGDYVLSAVLPIIVNFASAIMLFEKRRKTKG